MATYSDSIRWSFGTVDIYGFTRTTPLVAGVLMEEEARSTGTGSRFELSARRIESGDHEAALAIELGMRARSWLVDVSEGPCIPGGRAPLPDLSQAAEDYEPPKNPTEYELAG